MTVDDLLYSPVNHKFCDKHRLYYPVWEVECSECVSDIEARHRGCSASENSEFVIEKLDNLMPYREMPAQTVSYKVDPTAAVMVKHCPTHRVVYREGDECGLCFDNRKAGEFTEIQILQAKQRMLLAMIEQVLVIVNRGFTDPNSAKALSEILQRGFTNSKRIWDTV